jgi:hypothetical protein
MARDLIQWEADLTYHFGELMNIGTTEARGALDAIDYLVRHEWCQGVNPLTAAQNIVAQLKAETEKQKAESAEHEMLFIPIDGYVTEEQLTFKVLDMSNHGFDEETMGWAYSAQRGDCRRVDHGTCACVLVRMK